MIDISKKLLQNIPGDYDPISVTSWLFAGDSAPNPFEESGDDYQLINEVYSLIKKMSENMDIEIPPSTVSKLTKSICQYIEQSEMQHDIDPEQNDTIVEIIKSQLILIKSGINS